jgi:micrococcal nuclease
MIPTLVLAKDKVSVTLNECVDGDTAKFNVNGEVKTARFLAIDTPETVKPNTAIQPFGKEARKYTCNALTNAQKIELEYDSNATTDKYKRILVWVWVDGSLLNDNLVKLGLAKVAYLYDDYTYTSELKEDELVAKAQKLKIWSEDTTSTSTSESTATSTIETSSATTSGSKTTDMTITIIWIAVIILFCIFNKSYRKKTINRLKRKGTSELKKLIKLKRPKGLFIL